MPMLCSHTTDLDADIFRVSNDLHGPLYLLFQFPGVLFLMTSTWSTSSLFQVFA